MKRLCAFLITLLVVSTLCACGSSSSTSESNNYLKAPAVIYTTSADENGYGDTNMFVEGTVGKPFEEKGKDVCEVVTKEGKIALFSIPLLTSSKEWAKLKEGEWVRVNFQYLGYSDVLDVASGALISVEDAESAPEPDSTVVKGTLIEDNKDDVSEEDNSEWAKEFTPINDFYYSLDKSDKTITLNKYKDFGPKIMLSPVYTIDGVDYSLKSVGDACFFGKISLTSVYIPEGATSIADNAFNSCSDLQYLYLPSTLESVTDSFLEYIGDYNIYCDSVAELPVPRDTNDYNEIIDDRTQATELGESAAGAVNGLFAGLLDGLSETTTTTEIYFGGAEEIWRSIRR